MDYFLIENCVLIYLSQKAKVSRALSRIESRAHLLKFKYMSL